MLIRDQIVDIARNALKSAVKDNKFTDAEFPEIKVEYPREEKFGDYALPFALEAAKVLRRSPVEIGNTLKEYFEESDIFERVDVVKPGFINLFLSNHFLYQNLLEILKRRDDFGKERKENPGKVNIEFVSANPTGPLNIVSARAAAIGDTIANLLEACGNIVDREYYINDFGNQVELLGKSVLCRYKELNGEEIEFPENGYQGEYIKDIASHFKEKNGDEIDRIKSEEELAEYFSLKAVEYNVETQKSDLQNFNIAFKTWYSERSIHERGDVQKTLEYLESLGHIYEDEGKKVFKAKAFGDDKDRVVVRDDGRPTYLLADIAYHKDKKERGYDYLIDIWGPDHHGYISRIKGSMEAMGFKSALSILIAQQVNLIVEGDIIKMSKRLGQFSTMKELIEDIGVDAARYFFIMRSIDSPLDFDLDLAKRESSENPIFYLQYAHARICSIFREADKRGVQYSYEKSSLEYLQGPEVIALMKQLTRFPEEIVDSAVNYEPHRIANYLMKLAQLFHKFYTVHRVLTDNPEVTNTNLTLCDAARIVLRNGLKLLGVSAPDRM